MAVRTDRLRAAFNTAELDILIQTAFRRRTNWAYKKHCWEIRCTVLGLGTRLFSLRYNNRHEYGPTGFMDCLERYRLLAGDYGGETIDSDNE